VGKARSGTSVMTSPNPTLAAIARIQEALTNYDTPGKPHPRAGVAVNPSDIRTLLAALEEKTQEAEELNEIIDFADIIKTGILDAKRAAESALSTSRERERDLEKALEAVDRTLGDGDEGLPNGWLSRCERSLKTIRKALALRPLVVGDEQNPGSSRDLNQAVSGARHTKAEP
jgi:hypothetical protein